MGPRLNSRGDFTRPASAEHWPMASMGPRLNSRGDLNYSTVLHYGR